MESTRTLWFKLYC